MKSEHPFISVIVPVHNGEKYIAECLEALRKSSYKSYEIIVADDGSTDNSADVCRSFGAKVVSLQSRSGPASARNAGVKEASGDIILFIDADVVARQETLRRVATTFQDNPDVAAVFGSYDDSPSAPDFLSQYRNLLHHYVHQRSGREAKTFWAGCGAVRRDIFLELGGFDSARFEKPSIEDIELGYRMTEKGYKIILDKELQVKHLKEWDWDSMLRTDIFSRAVPWSRLIIESNSMPVDLNLSISDRISTLLTGVLSVFTALLILGILNLYDAPGLEKFSVIVIVTAIAGLIYINRGLYGFFLKKRGMMFTLMAIPVHFLFYFYSGAAFTVCWIRYNLHGKTAA